MRWLRSLSLFSCPVRYTRRPRYVRPYLRDLYMRRLAQGPEPYRPRSAWVGWNGQAELFAFQHRIGEQIPAGTLQRALLDVSFGSAGAIQTEDPGTTEISEAESNVQLVSKGREISQLYVLAFLRTSYPRLPEEFISTIAQFLLADEQLALVASSLGLKDLVVYADSEPASGAGVPCSAPPSCRVLADGLLAIVGALATESSHERAVLFVRDFILTPLADPDLLGELVTFEKPMQLLTGVLAADKRAPPEPRLQYQTGMNTILACYQVGIYSNRELLGEAPGETIEIAVQEAASQALRNLFGLADHRPPLQLHGPLQLTDLSASTKPNVSLDEYMCHGSPNQITDSL